MLLGFLIANAPDLDLLLGLALEGDTAAFHRHWWNHSPIIALYGVVLTLGGFALLARLRGQCIDWRKARLYTLFVVLALLSHLAFDFVIVNPFFSEASTANLDEFDNLVRAAGRQLLNFFTDFLIYGATSLAFYSLFWLGRRWYQQRVA